MLVALPPPMCVNSNAGGALGPSLSVTPAFTFPAPRFPVAAAESGEVKAHEGGGLHARRVPAIRSA